MWPFHTRATSNDGELDAAQTVKKQYDIGICVANRTNNQWRILYVFLRILLIAGPLLMAYLVGELTPENWESMAKNARLCGFVIAIAAGLDAWLNPQRISGRAAFLRNSLHQYRERLNLAIAKKQTGQAKQEMETWFLDKYQELWSNYNQIKKPLDDDI